jgi:hypothetical protein
MLLIFIVVLIAKCEKGQVTSKYLRREALQGGNDNKNKSEPHWGKYIGIYCKDLSFCNADNGQTCFANKCLVVMYGKCNKNSDCLNTNQSKPYLICDKNPNPKIGPTTTVNPDDKVCIANKTPPSPPKTK